MSIEVIQPGLLTTVQDLGRYGYQKYGVIVSGAMDSLSVRLANLLVGNKESDAVLEMTLQGPSLKFQQSHVIAICGGDFQAMIDNHTVPPWRPVWVRQGSVLRFGKAKSGCRAYLSISGGIDVPKVLGSKSTYLRAGLGGFLGRPLKKGDLLAVNQSSIESGRYNNIFKEDYYKGTPFKTVHWSIGRNVYDLVHDKPIIQVIQGPQFECFTSQSQFQLFKQFYQVSPQSDRMGYRLIGPRLELKQPIEMTSEAVCMGTIQVPPNGEPILLLADRQTTGGYPIIGFVASVDLPTLGQLKPGDKFKFKEISLREAQWLFLEREKGMKAIKIGINSLLYGR